MPMYRITSVASGLCLDVPGFSKAESVQIQQYNPNRGLNQVWYLQKAINRAGFPSPGVKIRSADSALVLDVRGGLQGDHTIVQQYHDTGGSNQQWYFDSNGDGEWTISALNPDFTVSNQVLDVVAGSTDPGAKIQTFSSHGSPNQKWVLQVMYDA